MDEMNQPEDNNDLETWSKRIRDEIYLIRFWEHQYTKRHILLHHYNEVKRLRIDFKKFLDKIFGDFAAAMHSYQIEYHCYNLIKAWHLMRTDHGLPSNYLIIDIIEYVSIINSLDNDDASLIERIHDLSYKFGFPVLDFDLSLDSYSNVLINKLQSTDPEKLFQLKDHQRLFYKKGPMLPGIYRLYTTDGPIEFKGEWDLAIYASIDDKPHHISNELKRVWDLPGQQVIGNELSSKIAFYIDRNTTRTRSWVRNLVILEIQDLKNFIASQHRLFPAVDISREISNKELKAMINHSEISQGLTHKRWDKNKANVRRTVGLYLWDNLNDNSAGVKIHDLISELIDKYLPAELLELYHKGYNSRDEKGARKSGLESVHSTIVAEMYHDLELTKKCISDYTYYLPSQIKKLGK